jgi:5-oxoprolinase (ATP-hydrolysing)
VVQAAVLYVLRSLVAERIPLNGGCLDPVEILVPPGSLLDPPPGSAVVGGNVETSQRVVDVIFGALRIAAASQGTMNNVTFGDATGGYYETICGGSGATPDAPGADAVHTHMTNTRLTDPEVIERRYPVRIRRFAIRRGSGGAGAHRGGHGVVREIEFLRPQDVSILSERRGDYAPYGQQGGGPGECGQNTLREASGEIRDLGGKVQFRAKAGDVLVIETPGGGGWGKPKNKDA